MKTGDGYVLCIRKKSTPFPFYRILLAKKIKFRGYKILRYRRRGIWREYIRIKDCSEIVSPKKMNKSYNVIKINDYKKLFELSL